MSLAALFIVTALVILFYVTGLFILSLLMGRNDIADIGWGIGIMLVALIAYTSAPYAGPLMDALTLLAVLWAVRLAVRIYLRNAKKQEDPRYASWRESWGRWFYLRSYTQIYLLQGALMIVVGYPFLHAYVYGVSAELNGVAVIGMCVWLIGFIFESIGDWQLDSFIKNPENKGRLLTSGLWAYSRHPNYFGEVTQWWGIWLMVATLPYGLFALISPLMITFLILAVSGIPMLEKRYEGNSAFAEYKKRTSAFFPLPPRA